MNKPPPVLRPLRPVRVLAAGASDIGRVCKHDDDTTLVRPDLQLYLAADGVGGHNAGNVASALAAASVAAFLENTAAASALRPEFDSFGLHRDSRRLASAIQYANRKIVKAAAADDALAGMGTTIVAVLLSPSSGSMALAHVGDSRCYRLRDGHLELLTFDHSLVHEVLELRPDIEDAALARLRPNVLTRALGMEDVVRVSVRTVEVAPGDRFVLCSDGLTDAIDPEAIAAVLGPERPVDTIVSSFIDAANDAGGPDNISVVVIVCQPNLAAAPLAQRLPLPRPRRRKRRAPPVAAIVRDDDGPDLVMEDEAETPRTEVEAPVLSWDASPMEPELSYSEPAMAEA